jgi:hypothetical protein
MSNVFLSSGEVIVNTEDIVSIIEKPLAKMRAEKPCSSSYKNPFHYSALDKNVYYSNPVLLLTYLLRLMRPF